MKQIGTTFGIWLFETLVSMVTDIFYFLNMVARTRLQESEKKEKIVIGKEKHKKIFIF